MPERPPEELPEESIDRAMQHFLAEDGTPDAKDETIATLENSFEQLENKLYEERFIWILACIVLIDIYVFSNMENWAGPLVIGILELVGVVIIADRCKVDTVLPLIDRITGFVRKQTRHDESD